MIFMVSGGKQILVLVNIDKFFEFWFFGLITRLVKNDEFSWYMYHWLIFFKFVFSDHYGDEKVEYNDMYMYGNSEDSDEL